MQQVVWSETRVIGPGNYDCVLPRPRPDIHADEAYPVYAPNGKLAKPEVSGRTNYFRDIVSGTNGSCGYLCTARKHYDYVTGLGSPLTVNF